MKSKILLTAVLLIVFVCENAAVAERSTKLRPKSNSNDRKLAVRRLIPVDSRWRPSWLRKRKRRPLIRPERNKPKKLRNKNKAKATKKNDGKSTLVAMQSSPQAGQAVRKGLKKNERYVSMQQTNGRGLYYFF